MDEPKQKVALTPNTYISISLLIVLIGASLWINNSFYDLRDTVRSNSVDIRREIGEVRENIKANSTRMDSIEKSIREQEWSYIDQYNWSGDLQQQNPALKVPRPKHEK